MSSSDPQTNGVSLAFLWVLLSLLVAAGAWDIYASSAPQSAGSTVSQQFKMLMLRWPELGFLIGFLMGHVFSGR